MKTYFAERIYEVVNGLGEGPLWHPIENQLYWTDILTGTFYRANPSMDHLEKTFFDLQIGAFAFRKEGGFILATNRGFYFLSADTQELKPLWNPLKGHIGIRLNDGKVDPAGRFWAGSMDLSHKNGALFRLDPDGSQHTILTEIGISNGLDWSPDCKKMYYTDSMDYTIYVFDYDLESGEISNKKRFVELPRDENEIMPDGLCVDQEGCVWSAHWNGWEIVRYDPEGEPIAVIKVPAQRVTSCCFGGENLDTLFITSSRADLTDEQLTDQPHAGDVFICQVETRGQITNLFN